MAVLEVLGSSALLYTHQILFKLNSCVCTNLWYIYFFISPRMSNLWPLFSEAAFSTVYFWRTKYNSNWQSFWTYYWREAQGAKIIIFVWNVSYQTQTLGGLDWTPLPSCRLCLWYWVITSFGWNSMLDRKFLTYWGVWTELVNKNETI